MVEYKPLPSGDLDALAELARSGEVTRDDAKLMLQYCNRYKSPCKSPKTIFDFDLSDPNAADYKKNLIKCWFSLKHRIAPNTDDGTDFVTDHVGEYFSIDEIAPDGHGTAPIGIIMFLLCNQINHGCYSNVKSVIVNNQSVLYVTRPIKAGEQLFYNFEKLKYLYSESVLCNEPLEERKKTILELRGVECNCYYCVNDITDEKLVKGTHPEVRQLLDDNNDLVCTVEYIDYLIDELQEYWDMTNRTEDNPTSYDLADLRKRSDQLIKKIADLVSMPCMNLIRGPLPADMASIIIAMNHDIRDNTPGAKGYFTCKACTDKCNCRKHGAGRLKD